MSAASEPAFVGIQISPISFIDEGVETVLDTLRHRVGVDTLLIGTLSWLGLKVGRRVSHAVEAKGRRPWTRTMVTASATWRRGAPGASGFPVLSNSSDG